MSENDVLEEAFSRIPDAVQRAVEGLDAGQLTHRPQLPGSTAEGNSVAWLVWHLARVQDNHIADAAGEDEVWLADGWAERFNLELPANDTGYGHGPDDVSTVRAEAGDLLEYHRAVHVRTLEFVRGLSTTDLNRVIDTSWDPPVTLRVRLVSVIEDCLQHAGQAAYVRGLLA